MNFRYSRLKRWAKKIYRKFFPVPGSPWTKGQVDDICAIHLVPPEKLKSFFTYCIQTLQHLKGNAIGDYLEFGVFNGSSMGSAYQAIKSMNLESTHFFGFDAFQGLPEETDREHDVLKKGFYACSFGKMNECLKRRGIDPDEITWVKGWYNETLNKQTTEKYSIRKIGIVFIDCDTYSSSKCVLDFLAPLVTEPAIFCFDDWKLYDMDLKETGEYRSFNEFLEANPHLEATEIKSYNRKSKTFLVQPR
ncbi:MAG TPA: TylF/MycF/NovP-related O-methyltransferase [Prolixibacteraceae bacterium]|nr:TylF/MycF/NovP-related O-methyltransferase [Prolixibacteraceae bacterium]